MTSAVVYSRSRVLPCGVEDLRSDAAILLDQDSLITAGQALTWQSAFTRGALTAIPLTKTSAVLVSGDDKTDPERWYDQFTLGLIHRLKGDLAVAAVTGVLLREAASGEFDEDAKLLGSAIDGFTSSLTDFEDARAPNGTPDRIVADTVRTHTALLGKLISQQVWARSRGEFTIHSVRSVSANMARCELEAVRARIGLPWPSRVENGLGQELGLARWRVTMQTHGHQMWCRLEGENALVTELWLRNLRDRPE